MRAAPQLTLVGLAMAHLALSACGPSAQRLAAEETIRTASRGVAEVHASGGESPAVTDALGETDRWLADAEDAVSRWGDRTRSLAYETMAPCLARSLRDLRDALVADGRAVPADLESAEAAAAAIDDHPCPRRARESGAP